MITVEWWHPVVVGTALLGVGLGIGTWVHKVNSDRKSFREFMVEVRNGFRDIHDTLNDILWRISSASQERGGSLRLSDKGRVMSKSLRVREWASDTGPGLRSRVEGMNPYRVQEFCFDYAKEEFDPADEQEIKIKECAYENAVTRDEVLDVFAIELRDFLLKADNHREGSGSPTHAKGTGDSLHHA